jgi:tRNA (guanine37-N1)-methyltransferase
MVPGVLPNEDCYENESVASGLLEYPQYTRPFEFHGVQVPDVLISGNHENIETWRFEKALELTKNLRPDLYEKINLSEKREELKKQIRKACLGGKNEEL